MSQIIIMATIIIYLAAVVYIGVLCSKKNNAVDDFYLGGRKLGPFVTAMSAEASDMSSWLLMGLPGLAYLTGVADAAWTAIGLAIGTYVNWLIVAKRIRKYTQAYDSFTIPDFFSKRFGDEKRILTLIAAIVIVVFFIPYTASGFAACGKLFSSLFGFNYLTAMIISAIVIVAYCTLGGFLAASMTDLIQSIVMTIALVVVVVYGVNVAGGFDMVMENSKALPGYLGLFDTYSAATNSAEPYSLLKIASMLAWGLGYFGMPHILIRFMAVKSDSEIKKSRKIAIVWVIISLAASCLIGLVARGYLIENLDATASETVFIRLIQQIFSDNGIMIFIGGIFLCGILAAIMSTADSQLLVTASAVSEDIYKGVKKNATEKSALNIGKVAVVVVAIIGFVIAINPNSSIMGLVSDAWAGFGSAFGPVVLLALFWKRSTLAGAISGMATGALTVIVWDYLPLVNGVTLYKATNLYSLVLGFALALIVNIIVSLIAKKPSKEIQDEFDSIKSIEI
mgnify:CR=1 FL=1